MRFFPDKNAFIVMRFMNDQLVRGKFTKNERFRKSYLVGS